MMRIVFGVVVLGFMCACSGTYKQSVNLNPTEPIRVLILPFVQVDGSGRVVMPDTKLAVDNVALISDKLEDTPAQFLQKLVENELIKSSLDVISPGLVELELVHHGFAKPDLTPDAERVLKLPAHEVCTHLLSCDAVLYGTVTRWDRNYYAIETVNSIGFELKLVGARDGKVLFEAKAEDSERRGLSKGPTGFSNIVLEPIRGLDNEIITDLARSMVTKSLASFRNENRPEFLETAPPAIMGAAHDAFDGVVRRNVPLTVLVAGTSKQSASFSIGKKIEQIPMAEREPGKYIGEYHPLGVDSFSKEPVTVALTDQFGRRTTLTIADRPVSLR